jgi:hypothetical protein
MSKSRSMTLKLHVVTIAATLLGAGGAYAATDVAPDGDLAQMTLMNASEKQAVVRFGDRGPLYVIAVGDRIGKRKATVKEVALNRIVLDEAFTGADGRPNRATIVLKKGETGGTRLLQRLETEAPAGRRPLIVEPPADPKQTPKPKGQD